MVLPRGVGVMRVLSGVLSGYYGVLWGVMGVLWRTLYGVLWVCCVVQPRGGGWWRRAVCTLGQVDATEERARTRRRTAGVVWRSIGFLPWTMAVAKDRRGRWG